MTHRWSEPRRPDLNTTFRTCVKCGLVKVSRHEADSHPQHWIEWEREGARFNAAKTPACNLESDMTAKKKADETAKIETPYRLVSIQSENFKKLKAVRIDVDGAVVQIAGRNEQGKSSVLDGVMAALGGKDYFPPEPIRKGQRESVTTLDFGGLKLTRRIWLTKSDNLQHEVRIEYADGSVPAKPQDVLDALRGSPIADDPLEFARMAPKARADLVKKLVPGFDFAANAKARKDLYDARTQVGRERDRAKAAVEAMPIPAGGPKEAADIGALTRELTEASAHNADVEERRRNREKMTEEIDEANDEADRLERQVNERRAAAKAMQKKLDEAKALPSLKDVEAIAQRIHSVEADNEKVRDRAARELKAEERDSLAAAYDGLTSKIDGLDDAKAKAIAGAKLPVKGLQIDDEDVALDGLPFEQASTARKIRVATALLMALKPSLRVLLIREGSLLDQDAREALRQDAEANGFVVLMETVGDAGDGGVLIEDGEVA